MRKKLLIVAFVLLISTIAFAQNNPTSSANHFTIENYYKVKWGYAEEFIDLWKKNHYPLLKKLLEKGDLISIHATTPHYHTSEDSRWDFKVSLTFKTIALAFDHSITDPYKKQLFPDQESYKKQEQHRFELLLAHWDIPVEDVSLN